MLGVAKDFSQGTFKKAWEESCYGESISLCFLWQGIYLKIPPNDTHKE